MRPVLYSSSDFSTLVANSFGWWKDVASVQKEASWLVFLSMTNVCNENFDGSSTDSLLWYLLGIILFTTVLTYVSSFQRRRVFSEPLCLCGTRGFRD